MDIPLYASKLNLSSLGLTEIPPEIFLCKNLKKLNLSNNRIKVIPAELCKLKQLRNLDLSNNEITTLYAKNFDFKQLEVLILKNNKIKKIPHQIGAIVKLKKLNLSGNQIETFPNDITRLSEIVELNLAGNLFASLPAQIFKFTKLKALWLNNNPIENFPVNEFNNALSKLVSLYCFSPLNNSALDANYKFLQGKKGNCIGQFKLLVLKDKSKPIFKSSFGNYTAKTPGRKSLFISYCHADIEWLNKVNVALQTMAYEGLDLEIWDDTRINAGDLWKKEIEAAISKADVAILLISNNFLASKFIREEEVPPLLKKAEQNGAKILPVIVGLCRFTQSILKDYQAVNKPEKPMNALPIHEQDKVIYELTLEIDKAFGNL